jgi:hypothetical protein
MTVGSNAGRKTPGKKTPEQNMLVQMTVGSNAGAKDTGAKYTGIFLIKTE